MIPVFIRQTIDKPTTVPVRAWRTIMRRAHEEQGREWCVRYLPLHFTRFAGPKYGYTRRSKKYLEKKLRMGRDGVVEEGGQVDLVYTGRLRRAALAAQDVRGYPTRATIKFAVPPYATINYKPYRPRLGQELVAVAENERRELSTYLSRRVELHLAAWRDANPPAPEQLS